MFNWIKNLFGSTTNYAEPAKVDTTTNWPLPTAETPAMSAQPAANDPALVTEAKSKAKATNPKATATKKAAPKTAPKKPAAIKAAPAKRGRKPKTGA